MRVMDADPSDTGAFWAVFSGLIITLAVSLFIFSIRLISRIDEVGIHANFQPFNMARKHFKWEEIARVEIVDYSPLREYGGWGYRISFNGSTALNIRGNKGIKIFSQNGKQFLIGTQRPEDAQKAIESYFKANNNQ